MYKHSKERSVSAIRYLSSLSISGKEHLLEFNIGSRPVLPHPVCELGQITNFPWDLTSCSPFVAGAGGGGGGVINYLFLRLLLA